MNATTQPPRVDLVVARFQEDASWLKHVPGEVQRWVYDKSDAPVPTSLSLPNVGREAHTYLHHIVSRYDDLAELTVFAQGRPFDHAPDFHKRLRDFASGAESVDDFRWLGFLLDRDDRTGSRLFQRWSKNPEARPLDMRGFWAAVFAGDPLPESFHFFGGAQFVVTRDCLLRRPRAFYANARGVAESFPDAAHCFERTWDAVFGVNGIPTELRNRDAPVYLKPIRRLRPERPAISVGQIGRVGEG